MVAGATCVSALPALAGRSQHARTSVPVPSLPGGWLPMPRRLIEVAAGLSRIERAVTDLILLRTIGDEATGRPDWAAISEPEFADYAGASLNGVHHAVTRLERMRVIESQPAGRSKRYRLTLDSSADVPTPAPRRMVRKPPQSEQEARHVSAPALAAAPAPTPPANSSEARPGETQATDPGGVPVQFAIPPAAKVVTISNATSARLAITAAAGGAALNIAIAEACTPAPSKPLDEDREFLLEFVPLLHCAPRDADVEALAAARAGVVSIEQLRAYVGRRIQTGLVVTGYGIFAKLAEDCVPAADRWAAAHVRPDPSPPVETLGDRMLRWADRLEAVSPELVPVAAEVRTLAADAASEPERLAGPLEVLHGHMLAIARTLAADRMDGLRRQSTAELEPLRDRMSRAQFAELLDRQLERRILEALGLPALDPWSL